MHFVPVLHIQLTRKTRETVACGLPAIMGEQIVVLLPQDHIASEGMSIGHTKWNKYTL